MPAEPTHNVTIGPAWGLVVGIDYNFLLTLRSAKKLEFALMATETLPSVDEGHVLASMIGDRLSRIGNNGPCPPGYLYMRLFNSADSPVKAALDTWLP